MMRLVLLVSALVLSLGCGEPERAPASEARPDLPEGFALVEGERRAARDVVIARQPSEARLREVAQHFRNVLSLRELAENPYDELALASELDLSYTQYGVNKQLLRDAGVRNRLYEILDETRAQGEPVYVHCAGGDRAAALWALFLAERRGVPAEEAIQAGKAVGLVSFEGTVREILSP